MQTLREKPAFALDYGPDIEAEITHLEDQITTEGLFEEYPPRWLAIKLLESDADIQDKLRDQTIGQELLNSAQESLARLSTVYTEDIDTEIASARYAWINHIVGEVVERPSGDQKTWSDRVDRWLTHRQLGLVFFLVAMWAVFKLTADVSAYYLDWIDGVITGPFTSWVYQLFSAVRLGGTWFESMIVDGVIAGVGGVLVFVPVLGTLYIALAILEDSGYMARAAFVMDRGMRKLGLHGKSFLPMLVGFGCTVPALYATRTLENEKDRILTGLLVPFMSCGARLPVYVLFAAIFFPKFSGLVVFGMYLLGILTAILLGFMLRSTVFKSKEQAPFVMELPPYRVPSLRGIWFHVWTRTKAFLENAWTIIMVTSVILWLLMSIPLGGEKFANVAIEDSVFGLVTKTITPVFAPLGFDSWEASGALVTGFVAKEVVVSTLSQVYGVDDGEVAVEYSLLEGVVFIGTSFFEATINTLKAIPSVIGINLIETQDDGDSTDLMSAIRTGFGTASRGHGHLAGLAFMVFVLLYTPCMVAIAAEKQELGAKWMWVSIIGQFSLAWIAAFVVFQGGLLLGLT